LGKVDLWFVVRPTTDLNLGNQLLNEFHFSSKHQMLDLMMGRGGRFWALPE